MKTTDIVIVGRGLFGSFSKIVLGSKGYEVKVIDQDHLWAGSKCSMGVWKESWLGKLTEYAEISLPVMEKFIEIKSIPFIDMDKENFPQDTFLWADRDDIITNDYIKGQVLKVKNNIVFYYDSEGNKERIIGKKAVIIAAGFWTDQLLFKSNYPIKFQLDGYWGGNMDLNYKVDIPNRMMTWAPYKQSVLVELNGILRFSDGVTVKNPKSDVDKRIGERSERIKLHAAEILGVSSINHDKIIKVNEGIRPYMRQDIDYVNQHDKKLFSATGGRKSSTVLCGYVASKLSKMIG